jgi:hypothetical protein
VPGSDADLLLVLSFFKTPFLNCPLEFFPYFEDEQIPLDCFVVLKKSGKNSPCKICCKRRDPFMILTFSVGWNSSRWTFAEIFFPNSKFTVLRGA